MQRYPRSVKRVGATWGISGDVYHMYIVLFYRYANHISVSRIVRTNHGIECELSPTMRTPLICVVKAFLLVRNEYDRHVVMHSHAA
jgi:hypothetical protein